MVRFGLSPDWASTRAASSTTIEPVPLSVTPCPRSQLSRWAPRITTWPGRSLPRSSATVFHCCTGTRPIVFSTRPSRRGIGAGDELALQHRVVLVRDHEVRERRHPVGRAAHRHQRMLLRAVHQRAERARGLEHVREVERELPPREHRRGRRVGGRQVPQPHGLRVIRGVAGGHRGPVGVPRREGRARQHPGSANLPLVGGEAVRRRTGPPGPPAPSASSRRYPSSRPSYGR